MKRRSFVLIVLMCIVLTSCSSAEKYPFEYVGLYNTQIRQPIKIGMSKDDVEKMIGRGELNNSYSYNNQITSYKYGDSLYIDYKDNLVYDMVFYDPWGDVHHPEKRLYYELPGGINVKSTVTDFIELYKYVYEYTNAITSDTTISVFVEDTDSGYIVLSKDDLIDAKAHPNKNSKIYQIEIDYFSYDNISSLHIGTVTPGFTDWDKALKELNK